MERVLRADEGLSRSDLQAEPEEWTEDVLIDELIRAVGLNIQPGRPNPRYETPEWVSVEIPDFQLEERNKDGNNRDLWIIGENKSVNKFEDAQSDMQEYLGKMWWPDYGIATDGIIWVTYRIETSSSGDSGNGDVAEYYRSFSEVVDLRSAIRTIVEEEGVVAQRQLNGADVDEELQKFVDIFSPTALVELLLRKAPKQLRDERKSDVDAFYELYIELLFGESNTPPSDPTVVNMVVSGTLGLELDVESVVGDLDAASTSTAPGRAYLSQRDDDPTVMVFRSGAITVAGATTKEEVEQQVRWFVDAVSELGISVNVDVVLDSLSVKYVVVRDDFESSIELTAAAVALGLEATEYEPEQFPALIYRPENAPCTVLIFSTGRVLVTGVETKQNAESILESVASSLSDANILNG